MKAHDHWWYGWFIDKRGDYDYLSCFAATFLSFLIGGGIWVAATFEVFRLLHGLGCPRWAAWAVWNVASLLTFAVIRGLLQYEIDKKNGKEP